MSVKVLLHLRLKSQYIWKRIKQRACKKINELSRNHSDSKATKWCADSFIPPIWTLILTLVKYVNLTYLIMKCESLLQIVTCMGGTSLGVLRWFCTVDLEEKKISHSSFLNIFRTCLALHTWKVNPILEESTTKKQFSFFWKSIACPVR